MKTNGLICACAHYFFVLILTILVIAPVHAQVSFASLNSFSSQDQKNDIAAKFISSNDETESVTSGYYHKPVTAFSLLNTKNLEASLKPTSFIYPVNPKTDIGITEYAMEQLVLYAQVLKEYAIKNGYDTSYVFLSNMGMLSNKKRLFVVNLASMQIEHAGLVSQGRGQGQSIFEKQYSNEAGSRCTSLGRYKILGKYMGSYGESYRLNGLDPSNRTAFGRNIVLHPMSCIPDYENRMPACVSNGCPSVSSKFFSILSEIIDSRKKPILLWIFDSNLEELVIERGLVYTRHISKSDEINAIPDNPIPAPDLYSDLNKKSLLDYHTWVKQGMNLNSGANASRRNKFFSNHKRIHRLVNNSILP